MNRRTFYPASFIGPQTHEALAALPGHPWDVVTASAFLEAIGIGDRMMANRWIYRGCAGAPPFEPPDRWKVGSGAPRVIRKDRAIAWADTHGKSVPARECWPYAATELGTMGWPGLNGPDEVQEVLHFLVESGIVPLAIQLRSARDIEGFYA